MRKQRKCFGIVSVIAAGSLIFCGCGEKTYQKSKERYVVGVVTKSSTSEYWMSVKSGMEAAAAEYGMDVIQMSPDSELDIEVQEKQVEKLISQNVDALAVAPIDSYYTPDYLDKIKEKNIAAVTFDTGFSSEEIPYIGIDNYTIGYRLAQQLAQEMGHQGEVGVVAGNMKQKGHRERVEGFKEYMSTEAQISIRFVESNYANLQMSEQKVRDLMTQYPQIKGIMATSAVTAMGLVGELKNTEIKIVAVDEQEDSLKAVEEGEIKALAAQSGYEIGSETIYYIQELREGKKPEKEHYLSTEILTQENVKAYRREHESQKYKK